MPSTSTHGADGINGINGTNGTNGTNGAIGEAAVYNNSGTLQTGAQIDVGTVTLSSKKATINLSGSATFASSTSYYCTATIANGDTSGYALYITQSSGSQFTITDTTTSTVNPTVNYICVGT